VGPAGEDAAGEDAGGVVRSSGAGAGCETCGVGERLRCWTGGGGYRPRLGQGPILFRPIDLDLALLSLSATLEAGGGWFATAADAPPASEDDAAAPASGATASSAASGSADAPPVSAVAAAPPASGAASTKARWSLAFCLSFLSDRSSGRSPCCASFIAFLRRDSCLS
jgi:hypothetical protein